jgi:hypothetical protein
MHDLEPNMFDVLIRTEDDQDSSKSVFANWQSDDDLMIEICLRKDIN